MTKISILFLIVLFASVQEVFAQAYDSDWVMWNNRGGQALKKGDYKKAELFFEKALLVSKKFGNTSKQKASSLNNLAGVYMQQGLWKEAESYLVLSLSMREDLLSPKDTTLANTCHNLGVCAFHQEKLADARRYFSRALDIRYEANHEDQKMVKEMTWLSKVLIRQGNLDQAEKLLGDALVFSRKDPKNTTATQEISGMLKELKVKGD